MPIAKLTYEIDDALSIEDNLAALGGAIDALDPALSAILRPKLAAWASGEAVDLVAIWDALYTGSVGEPVFEIGDQA